MFVRGPKLSLAQLACHTCWEKRWHNGTVFADFAWPHDPTVRQSVNQVGGGLREMVEVECE